jgi:hypothetical protein
VAPRVAFEFVSAHSKKELSVPTVRGCHASTDAATVHEAFVTEVS